MWLDKEAGRLGNLVLKNDKADFVTLDSDGPELSSFLVVLEKDHYGDYVMDFREFARVLPKITKSTPWVGPTLHIYSESYRKEFGLEEYYSLYTAFARYVVWYASVLEGQDPPTQPSEVPHHGLSSLGKRAARPNPGRRRLKKAYATSRPENGLETTIDRLFHRGRIGSASLVERSCSNRPITTSAWCGLG